MKKADLQNLVVTEVTKFAAAKKLNKEQTEGIIEILNTYLAPKQAGAVINLDEVTKKDAAGKITHLLCNLSGKFLPATKEFFYEDKTGKGVGGTGLKRLSRQAEAIRKAFLKVQVASEKAITADLVDGKISREDAKKKLDALRTQKPDFSAVSDKPKAAETKAVEVDEDDE